MMGRPSGIRWVVRLLSCIRFDEVLVLQGAPMLGAVFAMEQLSVDGAKLLLLLTIGNVFLVAHVFLLNDWAGIYEDIRDPARSGKVFLNRGIQRHEVGFLLTGMLLLSLMTLGQLGPVTLSLGIGIAVASVLYSFPGVYLKGVPVANSLLHLFSGMLHFLLGYSVFSGLDAYGVEVALFFAVIFSAGHLTQEVRDFEADRRNGIQTNAVRFGKRHCFVVAFLLFTIADALLVALAVTGAVPLMLGMVILSVYPLHGYWTLQALRNGLPFSCVRRLQIRYRLLYAGVGVAMVVSVLMNMGGFYGAEP